jgi:lipoprotein-releasing system ATP-binding protein
VRGEGAAALVATHNHELASFMDRVVTLKDGLLVNQAAA